MQQHWGFTRLMNPRPHSQAKMFEGGNMFSLLRSAGTARRSTWCACGSAAVRGGRAGAAGAAKQEHGQPPGPARVHPPVGRGARGVLVNAEWDGPAGSELELAGTFVLTGHLRPVARGILTKRENGEGSAHRARNAILDENACAESAKLHLGKVRRCAIAKPFLLRRKSTHFVCSGVLSWKEERQRCAIFIVEQDRVLQRDTRDKFPEERGKLSSLLQMRAHGFFSPELGCFGFFFFGEGEVPRRRERN